MSLLARWMVRCLLTLAVLAQALLAGPGQAAARRVVVVVGSDHGLDREYPLRFAVRDAERFAQVMTELGQVDPEDVHLLKNPSKAEFLQQLTQLHAQLASEVTLVVYFSGHGSTLALHLDGEKLALSDLYGAVNQVPAQFRLLLVDACRGEARKGFQGKAEPFEIGIGKQVDGLVAIHSTGLGEIAIESNELRAGVFSHLFVSGLRGPADANHDDRISVSEAYDYAKLHRVEWDTPSPEMEDPFENTTLVTLTSVSASRSSIILPPGAERYVIFPAGSSTELVRAWGSPTASTRVALPGDQFVVYRGAGAARHVAEVAMPFGGTRSLSPSDFKPRPAGRAKGWFDDDADGGALRPHRIGLAGGALVDSHGGRGPAAALSYAYGSSGWLPATSLSAARLRGENAENWTERDTLQLSLGPRYAKFFESFSGHIGIAATMNLTRQELTSRQPDWSGARPTDSSLGVGYGGQADIGLSLPLLSWLTTDVGISGFVTSFLEQPEGTGQAGQIAVEGTLMFSLGLSAGL